MADPVAPEAARAGLEDRLQTLRQAGAAQVDPVRLHFLEVLARGIAAVPVAQQNLLQPRANAQPQSQRLKRRLHGVYAALGLPALAH